jgi:hypothetical protein
MGLNAQTTVPAFTAGQILTAAQQTDINTGIPVFATTVTRDAAFNGTGEKVLAEGQFAFLEDSNATQFYDGSAWQTLGGGLTLVKTQTIGTTVASVTVTGAFSATYNAYKIIVDGGVGSATALLGLQLGAANTGYYEAAIRANYSTGNVDSGSGSNTTSFSRVGNVNANYINLAVDLINPFTAKYTLVNGMWISLTQGGQFSGYLADTTSYTAFTLTPASGTLTGGNIKIYGYQI